MSVVIDSSVFVAAFRASEVQHSDSRSFLSRAPAVERELLAPVLVLPECAGAIARPIDAPETSRNMLALIERLTCFRAVSISRALAEKAANIAISCRLRGSDAVDVALAEQSGVSLITWDREMLERGAKVVRTRTPTEWLREQPEQ
ncbi:MAG: type II toxin-antitoxin system VapC family toxin [Phycisphaerae bacterium]|nr:type II toxin-antitoxin system VapC family toxin [Phycisphaerae bacterium]